VSNNLSEAREAVLRRLVTLELLDAGAVRLSFDRPFQLASGNYSPIYVNCRVLISRTWFGDLLAASVKSLVENTRIRFTTVAGGETAGIPFAAIVARALNLPMVYVRKAAKGHGTASLIEGVLPEASPVLLVEDLITDAGSKVAFINAIRSAKSRVNDVVVILDRLQGGAEALRDLGIGLHALTDIESVLNEAAVAGVMTAAEEESVRRYLASPRSWHSERGLPFRDAPTGSAT
jgi:orotate phosphoribosyltransferase